MEPISDQLKQWALILLVVGLVIYVISWILHSWYKWISVTVVYGATLVAVGAFGGAAYLQYGNLTRTT
jgi:hypothetical protein